MRRFKLVIITCGLVTISWPAVSDDNIRNAYIENYVEQVTPTINGMVAKYEPNLSDSEASAAVEAQARKMANCQYQVASQYPSKYSIASLEPVAQGSDLRLVTQNVNQLMQADLQQGKISMEEFKSMVETGVTSFKSCMAQ